MNIIPKTKVVQWRHTNLFNGKSRVTWVLPEVRLVIQQRSRAEVRRDRREQERIAQRIK